MEQSGLIVCINKLITDLNMVDPFDIEFVFKNEDKIQTINHHLQVTLFRIVQEQIKNIIKYSKAGKVGLQLSVFANQVHLLIEDNGIGFDARQKKRGIGLSNIFERTKLYNGRVDLKTQPGQGCKIKVVIPLGGVNAC